VEGDEDGWLASICNHSTLYIIKLVGTFTEFLKYAVHDYYINYLRIRPYDTNDERTIYCKVIISAFKIFGNVTEEIAYV
jgi:hypothetical protein